MRHRHRGVALEDLRGPGPGNGDGRPQTGPPAMPLLTSKLEVPGIPVGLVDRPRLGKLLDAGVDGPATLLSAPAGSGKTVLLSAWVRAGSPAYPVGWVTLERDDVGARFWSYVHAALNASAACGKDGRRALPPPSGPPDDAYLGRLANALTALPDPVVLVLDDFDRVGDPRIADGLEFLVRHAASRLRLVIATRVDPALPLPRWRLSGELTELRAPELSFLVAEAGELLAHHGLVLPEPDLRILHARTEGWAAGLRLAVLAMRGHPEPARFVGEFGGDDRGVTDYLVGEVLARQSAEVREVLLCTSVLQRFCGRLVEALTGRTDGERVLADLERANTFVVPLGARRCWYRYHALFGDALRAELRRQRPEWIPELHRRAASWHAANGRPADALRHALAARDWRFAKGLVTGQWQHVMLGAQDEAPREHVRPPPADTVRADPELALACAADRLNARDLEGAGGYLRLAARRRELVPGERRGRFTVMLAAFELVEAQLGGDLTEVLGAAAHVLALARDAGGEPDALEEEGARAIALAALGTARLGAGDLDPAEEALSGGLAAAERAGLACPRMACAGRLAVLWALRGELRRAEQTARSALGMPPCECRCHRLHSAHAYLARAIVHHERGRLEESQGCLDLAENSCGPVPEPLLLAMIAVVRTGLLYALGDLTQGYEVLLAGRGRLGGLRASHCLRHWFAAAEADLRTSYGDTATAREVLRTVKGTSTSLAVALARTYLRDDDPETAVQVLPRWSDDETGEPFLAARLDAGFVEALAARRAGDGRRASAALERVLELAEPEGFRQVFAQGGRRARDLLADHLDSGTAYWSTVSELISSADDRPAEEGRAGPVACRPLTDRELTVLRYLQSMLSNGEIASELCLSVNTVKTHVRNIYRKLDADRRREAVRRARELRLL
jgi:LuxR family maltose regulon positive regulatory protein